MPLELTPWGRKEESFRERKRERSGDIGSVARWGGSSSRHASSLEFNRAADFRRLPGHGKQGAFNHGHVLSRSCDKILEEDNFLPSVYRGNGKYGRNNKESRRAFRQREWRGHSWETANGSLNFPQRQLDTNNCRSVDDMLTYSSRPHSDFVNTWEQHQMKDRHDKLSGFHGLGTGQRCDRDSSLGAIDRKPLKWTRSSLSSRETGFNHSSSSRSIGGTNLRRSCERNVRLQHKNATAKESNSREAAPFEEKNSRKKPRLNWGEGLAKFERKKDERPNVSANKDGPVSAQFHMEPCNFLSPSLVDKSPKVSGFADCASPAIPSSVACSSSPGADDRLFGKIANVDSDVSNLSSSPGAGSRSHLQMISFNLEKVDIDSLTSLGSSIVELLKSDDLSSVDSSYLSSTTMNKLLILKADISKVLEVTETKIDLLEKELKSLKSESGNRFPCSAAVGSLMICYNAKSCDNHVRGCDKFAHPEALPVSSDDPYEEKMPLSTHLLDIHDNCKDDDIDSHGAAMCKFLEPLLMINAVSSCDVGTCSEDLDGIQSTAVKSLIPCRQVASVSACGGGNSSLKNEEDMSSKSSASFHTSTENILYNNIISCNKESAKTACELLAKLMPEECGKIDIIGARSGSCFHNGALITEKFAEKKRFARFKERVITLKFKALHHFWKEDMHLTSIRKYRQKSCKKHEQDLRTISDNHQKKLSSTCFRSPYPAGNRLRLVPTSEMVNYTSHLLSKSQNKIHRSTLKMPALILDQKERFLSSNGLVQDPLATEKERIMINPWTSEEREIFLEKFASFGKDFRKIASFLNHKTTADCVEFYYKNHKSDVFEKILRNNGGKQVKVFTVKTDLMATGRKWDSEVNSTSLEILSAASLMADGIAGNQKMHSGSSLWKGYGNMMKRGEDSITDRSNGFEILGDDRDTVAANVLAGICGARLSEAVGSRTTSPVDPMEGDRVSKCIKVRSLCKQPAILSQFIDEETNSDESCGEMDPSNWTDGEKAALVQAVSSFGNDFAMLAECIRTKTQEQCKVYFSKSRKHLGLDLMQPRPENMGSLVNDDEYCGRSGTDDACVVQSGSVIGMDTLGTKTEDNQRSADMNTYRDESNPVEVGNMSSDFDEPKEISGELDHEDVNLVSNACVLGSESKPCSDGNGVVLYSSINTSFSVRHRRAIARSDSIEIGKDKPNDGGAVTEWVSVSMIEPCHPHSVAKDRLVIEVSSGQRGNELEGSPRCFIDRAEAGTDVIVELKDSVHNSSTSVDTSLSSVDISGTSSSFNTDNQPQPCLAKPLFLGSSEVPITNVNSMFKNTDVAAVQCKKTTIPDLLPCDFQGSNDMSGHNSTRNHGYQLHNSGNILDNIGAAGILQSNPLEVPVKKELSVNVSCSSLATELPLQSQKIEQDDHYNTKLQCLSESEKTPQNGDLKLFGKILASPSSNQKPILSAKGNEENDTHHLKLSNASPSAEVDDNHYALEKTQVMSYRDGNKMKSGFSPLLDSVILPAKDYAASSNYPTSAKSELQALGKSDEQYPSGASSLATREVNGNNGVFDCQMFRNEDGLKVQPFIVDENHFLDAEKK